MRVHNILSDRALRRLRAMATWALLLAPAALCGACNRPGCDGQSYDPKAGGPQVTQVSLLGSFPDDPWTVLLGIDFERGSATLGQGSVLCYLNGDTTPTRLPLTQAYAQSGLTQDAPSGRLGILFPFNASTIQDGGVLRLGVQLEDGDRPDPGGRRSNCYNVDLGFDLSTAAAHGSAAMRERLALWQGRARTRLRALSAAVDPCSGSR